MDKQFSQDTTFRIFPLLLAGVLLLGAFIFPLLSAVRDFPFYRDQHLGTAIIYAEEGIDLLRPKMVGFTATDTPTPQEFPIWQAVAGVLLRFGGGWWGWGSVASLLLFSAGLWPMYQLGKLVGEESGIDPKACGRWSIAWLISVPIAFYLAGEASVDGWSFTTGIWFFYCSAHLIKSGQWGWFAAASFTGALASITKLPFFFACGVAAGMYLLMTSSRSPVRWVQLALTGAISTVIFLLWTKWCNFQLSLAEFPYWELRLSHNPGMWNHYFGTWEFKLTPENWVKGGWRVLGTLFGSFSMAAACLGALFIVRSKILWSWVLGCGAMLLVFTHLVLVHRHYYIIFAPAVAFACGALISKLQSMLQENLLHRAAFCLVLTVAICLATVQGLLVMEVPLKFDPYPGRIAERVNSLLPKNAKPLIQNGGWGGDILMRMKRPGLSIHTGIGLKTPEQLDRLRSLGYTHLVMLAESPLLHAFQVTNPGQADLKRIGKYSETTPVIAGWTPSYEDEDIVIFEVPH